MKCLYLSHMLVAMPQSLLIHAKIQSVSMAYINYWRHKNLMYCSVWSILLHNFQAQIQYIWAVTCIFQQCGILTSRLCRGWYVLCWRNFCNLKRNLIQSTRHVFSVSSFEWRTSRYDQRLYWTLIHWSRIEFPTFISWNTPFFFKGCWVEISIYSNFDWTLGDPDQTPLWRLVWVYTLCLLRPIKRTLDLYGLTD